MRNHKYALLAILTLALAPRAAEAHALREKLAQFLISNPFAANGQRQRPRLADSDLTVARRQMRQDGAQPAGSSGKCQSYRNGCVDCRNPQHPATIRSPGGYKVTFEKPGQNFTAPALQKVLTTMADKKKKNVRVTSAFRSCNYQAATKQGVPRSVHLRGGAADFKFESDGAAHEALANFARRTLQSLGFSGGTGVYCSDPAHVDVGNTRQWDWRYNKVTGAYQCGRRKK